MSLQYSDTTNKSGIIQLIEREVKLGDGGITNNPELFLEMTSEVNSALDDVIDTIFHNSETWNYDDGNHTDYPIITTDLTENQRDYTFVADEQGNLILDIFKVLIKNPSGIYYEVFPKDVQSQQNTGSFYDNQNVVGQPTYYDKTANGIFFDVLPNYTIADGVKIYINREGSYFSISDTTKKPGFAGLYHRYLVLRPSYQYAYRNSLANVNSLEKETLRMQEKIEVYYSNRNRDEKQVIVPMYRSSR